MGNPKHKKVYEYDTAAVIFPQDFWRICTYITISVHTPYVACPPCTYRCNEVHALGTHGCLQPQYRSSQVPPSCRDALDSRVRNQPSLQSVLQPFLPFCRIQTRKVQLGSANFERYHRSLKNEKVQPTTSGAPLLQRSTAEQHSSGCFSLDAGLLLVFCFSMAWIWGVAHRVKAYCRRALALYIRSKMDE